jgi:UDP-GlcNAc:undecaprenyl-phosphate GlcNAc-1-phosphate transferase
MGQLQPYTTFLATAVVAWLAAQALVARAGAFGLVDHPHVERKFHARPTPTVGGLAVAAGVVVAWLLAPSSAPPPGALVSFALILALGLADDRLDLNWAFRFGGQAVALLPMMLLDGTVIHSLGHLLGSQELLLGPLALPVTLFMGLGAINALNMIDGADGLAGSLGLTALLVIAAVAGVTGQPQLAQQLLVCAAGLAGFLVLNVRTPWQPKARAFLGNAGSELLGLVLAWAVIRLTQAPEGTIPPILAPFLIGPALLDCMAVMLRRMAAGGSPFKADAQHFHHLLQRAGVSVTGVMVAAVLGALAFAGAALLAWRLGVAETVLAGALLTTLAVYATWQARLSAASAVPATQEAENAAPRRRPAVRPGARTTVALSAARSHVDRSERLQSVE